MMTVKFEWADVFVTLLIGVGPLKAALVYLSLTANMSRADRRAVGIKAVTVAGIVAFVLLGLGKAIIELLHFSPASVAVAGGLVLLLLGLNLIMKPAEDPTQAVDAPSADQSAIAIFPIAMPLLLNPIGIVAVLTYSSTFETADIPAVAALLGAVLLIDVGVFLVLAGVKPIDARIVGIIERVLGFILAAIAVQLIVDGLADLGVITLTHAGG